MKYRKKPIVIEAMRFGGTLRSAKEICAWANVDPLPDDEPWIDYTYLSDDPEEEISDLLVHTLEGSTSVGVGDWVIKGIKGEFYPCKPDIFAATYEAVE